MNALHVPACKCDICKPIYQNQFELFTKLKEATLESSPSLKLPAKQEPAKATEAKSDSRPEVKNQSNMAQQKPVVPVPVEVM